jgi:ABC-type uncharacterized transport system permease subunit
MENIATSFILIGLTLASALAGGLAVRRLRDPGRTGTLTAQRWLVGGVTGVAGLMFLYRWLVLHGQWRPVAAHLDGLLLIAALLGGTALFFQLRPKLAGLSAFALPVLTLVLAWGVCAAAWTYRPFQLASLDPLWQSVHLVGVYLGTTSAAVAAMGGGMYLYVQHRLKRKAPLRGMGRLASLESLETLIIRTATLGFALLTLGLAAGLVVLMETRTGQVGWFSPKVVLAVAAWGLYALLMNVRHASEFRGTRAAWLSIVGLVLLLTVYGMVTAMAGEGVSPETGAAAGVSVELD